MSTIVRGKYHILATRTCTQLRPSLSLVRYYYRSAWKFCFRKSSLLRSAHLYGNPYNISRIVEFWYSRISGLMRTSTTAPMVCVLAACQWCVTTFLVFPMSISICNQYRFCRHIQSCHSFAAVLSDAINPLEMGAQNCNVACDVTELRWDPLL